MSKWGLWQLGGVSVNHVNLEGGGLDPSLSFPVG